MGRRRQLASSADVLIGQRDVQAQTAKLDLLYLAGKLPRKHCYFLHYLLKVPSPRLTTLPLKLHYFHFDFPFKFDPISQFDRLHHSNHPFSRFFFRRLYKNVTLSEWKSWRINSGDILNSINYKKKREVITSGQIWNVKSAPPAEGDS